MVTGMKNTPLPLGVSHRFLLHNSGALPPVHERFKQPWYIWN